LISDTSQNRRNP